MTMGKKIFKRDTNGTIRTWNYEVEGNRWRSHSGVQGGTLVTSGWTTCEPRSKPTGEEQALFEAQAEHGKKLDKDYALTEAGVDEERSFGAKPMLAHKFEAWSGACYSQPKLDGMRCKANRHGLWSRTGKPILSCPHIISILAPVFAANPDLALDGELYNHDLHDNFNELMSILRKSKPSDDDIAKAASIVEFHVYDLYRTDKTFSERDQMLSLFIPTLMTDTIVKVATTPVSSVEQLDRAYGVYLEAGYEGQMVRLDGPYENKRSKQLLKRKQFETREFEVIAVEAGNGNWAGLAKRVRFRLEDGRECGGGIRGTRPQMAELLAGPTPRSATIRFFERTPDGMPRFPVAIDFDRTDAVPEAA